MCQKKNRIKTVIITGQAIQIGIVYILECNISFHNRGPFDVKVLTGWICLIFFLIFFTPTTSSLHCFLEMGIPSSVDLVSSDPSLMVASFNSGHTSIFNMETRQRILTLESSVDTSMYQKPQTNQRKKIACLRLIPLIIFSVFPKN